MKTQTITAPHGYPSNPAKGVFYSITAPATLTAEKSPPNSAGDVHPLVRIGDFGGEWFIGKWSNPSFLPQIGERVNVRMNGLGAGVVVAYFVEDGYVGVEVACDKRPDWHVKQNGNRHPNPLVFGVEIEREQPAS